MRFLLYIFSLVLMVGFSKAHGKEITISNGKWPPYLGKNLPNFGAASHIITKAFAKEGYTVKYKWYGESWKRAFEEAIIEGKLHGTAVWSKTTKREEKAYFSDIVIPSQKYVFMYLKKNLFDWNKIKDLKDKTIGGANDYNYGKEFESAAKAGIFKLL